MRVRSIVLMLAVAGLSMAAPAGAADWPHWRGPNTNGSSPESPVSTTWPEGGPKKLWECKVGGGHSSPVVAAGRLFTHAGGSLICLDAATGEALWKCPFGGKDVGSEYYTPAVDDRVVYALSDTGVLLAVETATGNRLWSVDLVQDLAVPRKGKDPVPMGSPLVLGDRLILSRGLALDKTTGKLVWKADGLAANGCYVTPVAFATGNTTGILFYVGPKLVAVSSKDGSPLWSVGLPWWAKNSYSDPIVLLEGVFFDGVRLQFKDEKPEMVNPAQHLGAGLANPVVWEGHLYASCGGWGSNPKPDSYQLKCVDAASGTVKWTQKGIWGPLVVVDGKLLVATHKGEIVAVKASPEGFEELGRAMICPAEAGNISWSTPAFAGGRFYMRRGGLVVCLDLSGK